MSNNYTEYVSLGNNCEVAYQLRRILGRDSSSFFSWNVTSLTALENLIKLKFHGILLQDKLEPWADGSLVLDKSYNYMFHSPFGRADFRDMPDFKTILEEHRGKVIHLIDKFFRPRSKNERIAYFYKYDGGDKSEDIKISVRRIRDLLYSIHKDAAFSLIVLQDISRKETSWDEPRIFNRYLDRLSPWHDATDGHVKSWDKVFREFAHRDPLRLSGF